MLSSKTINGPKRRLEDWNQVNWRKINKLVKNLRQRIFRARKLGNFRKLRSLQKLMLRSYANLLLSVRRITQTNLGKATAGIDKEIVNTPQARVILVNNWNGGNLKPTRRVEIPKPNGKKRPLGIPTVRDRIEQAIVKNSLEPEWEAVFEQHSYGFRPGRSCHDAIGQCFNKVGFNRAGGHTWVLEADIKGFFDNIAHESILTMLGYFPKKELIKGWLKAGFVFQGELNSTEQGTPQGGVISPLLANIGLHGLETFIKATNPKLGVVRYADDFIVMARDIKSLETAQSLIQAWMSKRGLELSAEKTVITSMEDGFDFLGFNSRHYDGKLLIKPSKKKVLAFCKRLGAEIKRLNGAEQEVIIKKLNPILRGFANYYKGVVSKETFSYISHRAWKYLWRWAKRRHPNKNTKWVRKRYFKTIKGNNWKHKKLREIPIPKKDGTYRMLKVPTISDRAWQCLAKYALEPAHEATFHARSYGFRTGRSAHDAQKVIFSNLNSRVNGKNKYVLELDIEKCFDRINHSAIMDNLIAPTGIERGILRCLKAGVNPEFPEQGTPQGGVVSPLLANIALNGIEKYAESKGTPIRYADDMVVICKSVWAAQWAKRMIEGFLASRGMKISEKKTRITAATDGFDFLGWHFKVQNNGKFRSYPSKENFEAFRKKVKAIVNSSNYGAKVKAEKLAPLVRGWRSYHRYCKMDGSRVSLWHTALRTYRVFNTEAKQNRHSCAELIKKAFPAVPYSENRHINVTGNKSPYDGDITYWSERNSKLYDGYTSSALKRQNHSCGICGHKLLLDERVHLHHTNGDHSNWKIKNLLAVHQSCHMNHHTSKTER